MYTLFEHALNCSPIIPQVMSVFKEKRVKRAREEIKEELVLRDMFHTHMLLQVKDVITLTVFVAGLFLTSNLNLQFFLIKLIK